ncbi:hypothetical protein BRC81_08330 [Halobacteriales archaeon QS_1_68_20]|nr:MAG: hypothetical protein BRC81_08330 [Halobacteriales archaeon QS_1_68_20]
MDDGGFYAAALDALDMQAAVLDADGVIRCTNAAWRSFGTDNGLAAADHRDANYLDVCRRSEDDHAVEATDGIAAVLDGDRETFSLEHPCHSPDERRWFTMRVTGFEHDGQRYAFLVHLDITNRKLAESAVAERNERLETVAHVLGHDVQNPLQVAMGRLQFLDDDEDVAAVRSSLERNRRSRRGRAGADHPRRRRDQADGRSHHAGDGGLGIVSRIAATHGWSVSVAAAEGGGARFEVRRVEVTGRSG